MTQDFFNLPLKGTVAWVLFDRSTGGIYVSGTEQKPQLYLKKPDKKYLQTYKWRVKKDLYAQEVLLIADARNAPKKYEREPKNDVPK